jgi:MFS family permease
MVFGSSVPFRWYWAARASSLIGDGAAMIALLLFASAEPHPGPSVALILLAESVPRLFGPLAGAVADRVQVRRLLIVMELIQCAAFGVITAAPSQLALIVPLVALSACCSTVFGSAGRIVTPRLVAADDLMTANAWLGTAFNLQAVCGPLIGGVLVASIHARGAFAVNAASFAISAALLTRIPRLPSQPAAGGERPGFFADVAAGLRYTRRHRVTRGIVILLLVGVFFGSLDNVILVFYARRTLHTGPAGFGLLSAGFGIAMVATSIWLAYSARRRSPAAVLTVGWLTTGLGLLLTGVSPVLAMAVGMQLVAGLGNGLANVGEETLLQRTVPPDRLGRVGGTLTAAAFLGSTGSYAIGGWLAVVLSPRTVLIVAGAGLMAVTAICSTAIRGPAGEQSAPSDTDAPAAEVT